MVKDQNPVLRKTRWRTVARKTAMGKFRPRERSPRRESMKVIVEVFGWGERVAKKERRRWKEPCADMVVVVLCVRGSLVFCNVLF
jgi:hypothetical protein